MLFSTAFSAYYWSGIMTTDIASLLSEDKNRLANQAQPVPQSHKWYALGNFGSFVSAIEQDASRKSIARAVHALRHYISNQFGWGHDYCKTISAFCVRADRLRRKHDA